jgi:hypothetical protein
LILDEKIGQPIEAKRALQHKNSGATNVETTLETTLSAKSKTLLSGLENQVVLRVGILKRSRRL